MVFRKMQVKTRRDTTTYIEKWLKRKQNKVNMTTLSVDGDRVAAIFILC